MDYNKHRISKSMFHKLGARTFDNEITIQRPTGKYRLWVERRPKGINFTISYWIQWVEPKQR